MSTSMFSSYHSDNDFGPVKFTETKMHHTMTPRYKPSHVRRNLFGAIDRIESSRFAEEELAKHQMSASQKWGFDFVRGCPMDDASLFLWERVPPTNEIPEMYTLSRAAHIRPIEPDHTPSKKRRINRDSSYMDLYDELADQSNRYSNKLDLSFEDADDGETSASSGEESFEEEEDDNNLCDLNWMPSTSKLASAKETTTKLTEIFDGNATRDTLHPTLNSSSCDISCSDKSTSSNMCSKSHTTDSNATNSQRNSPRLREKRQFKITDFLKERKRLQPTIKKISPKKPRISPTNGTILAHFGPQR